MYFFFFFRGKEVNRERLLSFVMKIKSSQCATNTKENLLKKNLAFVSAD